MKTQLQIDRHQQTDKITTLKETEGKKKKIENMEQTCVNCQKQFSQNVQKHYGHQLNMLKHMSNMKSIYIPSFEQQTSARSVQPFCCFSVEFFLSIFGLVSESNLISFAKTNYSFSLNANKKHHVCVVQIYVCTR